MKQVYRHRQAGLETRIGLGVGVLLNAIVLLVVLLTGPSEVAWVAGGVLLLLAGCGLAFESMTVEVTEDELGFHFGPGAFRRRFRLDDVRAAHARRDPGLLAWGIHWTSRGWLYNVGGNASVEIELASGRALRIGTDEPEVLLAAIEGARAARLSAAGPSAPPPAPPATG